MDACAGERCCMDALGIAPGDLAAIIGCGGKTSLMLRLAAESRAAQTILSTTTRVLPPPAEALARPGVTLLAMEAEQGKLCGPGPEALAALRAADTLLLVEADGSKGLPLKGWAAHEPVIPAGTTVTVGVCTPWPIGQPLSAANTHRPERFCEMTGAIMGDTVTPAMIAAMISHPEGLFAKAVGRRVLYINQIETADAFARARAITAALPSSFRQGLRIACGSLRAGCFAMLQEGTHA